MTEHIEAMKAAFGRFTPGESRDDLCRVLVALARAMQSPNTRVNLPVNPAITSRVLSKLGMTGDFDHDDDGIIFMPEYDWED